MSMLALISCSSDNENSPEFEEFTELDFGKGIYRPNPFKFCDHIPPFSWMGMPDTVKKETAFEIQFNEDAIRNKSVGILKFVDFNGDLVKGIVFENRDSAQFNINATTDKKIAHIRFTVDPAFADSILHGYIIASGIDLDESNGQNIDSNAALIGKWKLTHETNVNWLRWTILLVIVVALLILICYIGYFLVEAVGALAESVSMVNFIQPLNLRPGKKQSKHRKPDNDNKKKQLMRYLRIRQEILNNERKSASKKAIALKEILIFLDYNLQAKPLEKETQYSLLNFKIRSALNELWGKFYACPKSNGHWSGEPCDSVWIPDDDYTPPNKSYSNIHGLTWREIKRKHGFKGLPCERGHFRFDKIAWHSVKLPNFAELVTSPDREVLHEAAFASLARQLGKTVQDVKAIKESANDHTPMGQKNLVWHEDIDCETLYLVPQEIHGNIIHFGGVAMCQLLCKYNLI